uniref:Uncharacterized protein n=1 Tax=Ciona savignyi TaxID=51511 RepID=H2ZFY6_CIOSA
MKANKVISDTFEKMDLENNTSSSSDSERSRIFEVPTDESSSSSPHGDSSEDQTSEINKLQRQPKFPMHGVPAQDEEREALLNERRLLIERLEHDSSTSEDLSQSEILDEMSSQHNRRKTEQRSDEDSSDFDQDIGNIGPRFQKDSFDDILEKVGLNENNSSQENRCVEKFNVVNRKKQRVSRSALEEEDSSEEILSEDSSSLDNSSSWTSSSEEMETLGQNNLEHDDVKTKLEL